jgi:LysM repeat protein
MKPTTSRRTRRLLARAATIDHAANGHDDYGHDDYGPEPNMKLSHAFLVVLLLHVIAVGGLYAFNSMKAGRQSSLKAERNASSPQQSRPPQEPKGANDSPGGSGEKPPEETKPAPVAKVAEQTSTTERGAGDRSAKGLLASARSLLGKTAAPGVAAIAATKASAQEASPSVPVNPPAESDEKTYTVHAGDTMTRIAATLGVSIPDLEKINGLAGNAVLQVGQILKVPAQKPAQVPSVRPTEASLPAAPSANPVGDAAHPGPGTNPNPDAVSGNPAQSSAQTSYTVMKGDNPYRIAKKFKITPDQLMKANGITDPKKIQIGQVLRIPSSAGKSAK